VSHPVLTFSQLDRAPWDSLTRLARHARVVLVDLVDDTPLGRAELAHATLYALEARGTDRSGWTPETKERP
jgi:hypothetical protein